MMEMKNSTQETLEKTKIHHNFFKNMEICKNTEEWHACIHIANPDSLWFFMFYIPDLALSTT